MATSLCRCCLAKICYKNISNSYFHCGKKEIYSEMLLKTFSISLSGAVKNRLICEECIEKLRDATAFKEQVLRIENKLITLLSKELKQEEFHIDITEIKIEPDDSFIFADDPQDDKDNISCDEEKVLKDEYLYAEPIKESIVTNKKSKTEIGLRNRKTVKKKDYSESSRCKKQPREKSPELFINNKTSEPGDLQLNLRANSLKLINNSNMCLFRSLKTQFGCFYCKKSFKNMTDLRSHSQSHATQEKKVLRSVNRLTGTSCRCVDITSLACKKCTEPCENLEKLQQHLTERHDINFLNQKHLLIPFKISDNLACVLCDENFNSYFKLYTHMHKHSNVSVCEKCGQSFLSRVNLRLHLNRVHKMHKCFICLEEFISAYAKLQHMTKFHNKDTTKKYCCSECKERFQYPYRLEVHKINEHGYKQTKVICKECGRTFFRHQNLIVHIRSVHKKERQFPCNKCDMRFFTKTDLRRHELSHDNVRGFSCDYCEAKFKTKDSWRRHMRKQHSQLYNCN